MYYIRLTPSFEKQHSKLVRVHPELIPLIDQVLRLLEKDTRFPSLKTHKVRMTICIKKRWSVVRQTSAF